MKIVTKLKLAAWAPLLLGLIIALALVFSYTSLKHAQDENRAARQIMYGVYELNNFTNSYMLHHEERPKRQFLMEFNSLTERLSKAHFGEKEQRQFLTNIFQNLEAMRNTFLKLVSNHEQSEFMENMPLRKEAEERLAGQILIRSRDTVANALRLKNLVDVEVSTTQKGISILIFFLIVATTLPLAVTLLRITRNIDASFAALRRGAQNIAAGNLKQRIGLKTRDEIGELAGAFDLMAQQLGEITVSRDELLAEIEERKHAQESLKNATKLAEQQRAELDTAFSSMNDAICITNKKGEFVDFNEAFAAFHRFKSEAECFRRFEQFTDIFRLYSPDGKEQPSDMWPLRRALRGDVESNGEYIMERTDIGEKWHAEYSFSPIKDNEGDITGAVIAMRDITERKKAEEEVKRISQFPKENPSPVMRCTPDGVLLYTNAPAERWLATFGQEPEGPLPDVSKRRGRSPRTRPPGRNRNHQSGRAYIFTFCHPPDRRRLHQHLRE